MTDLLNSYKYDPEQQFKIEHDMCSCCLGGGNLVNMLDNLDIEGTMESYFAVLNRCYNDQILATVSPLDRYYICDLCSQRLLDSYLFKSQVVKSQETILAMVKKLEKAKQDAKLDLGDYSYATDVKDLSIDKESDYSPFDDNGADDLTDLEPLVNLKRSRSPNTLKKKLKKLKKKKSHKKSKLDKEDVPTVSKPKVPRGRKPKKEVDPSFEAEPPKPKRIYTKRGVSSKILQQQNAEIQAAMDAERVQCRICQKTFRSFQNLNHHINEHFPNYTCEACGKVFATHSRLASHQKQHSKGPFKCLHCDMIFESYLKLNRHRFIHLPGTHKCPDCLQWFKCFYSRQKHMKEEHGHFPGFPCKICDYIALTSYKLVHHNKVNHAIRVRSHGCDLCDKEFFDIYALKNHMIVHNGDKLFQCSECGKSFMRRNNLRQHLRIHNKRKEIDMNKSGMGTMPLTSCSKVKWSITRK